MTQPAPSLDLTIRAGLELGYQASAPTPIVLLIKPRLEQWQHLQKEQLTFDPLVPMEEYEDEHGNFVHRFVLPPGRTTIRHDAFISVPTMPENFDAVDGAVAVSDLPKELLRYILPSRYCDSDRLLNFAFQQFGDVPHGLLRVQAICDWVHQNIEYRWGAGSPHTTASEIIAQRFGVCRDFAHTAIALCRTFNLPARYVTGYVPDVAFQDPGTPMDFHAYFQVYIGGRWQTYDARFNVPRIGRIKIACGCDAVDGAFSTLYGGASLAWFNVWAYQVNPAEVDLGDPIDLSKRLCGTPTLRFPTPIERP
ncbi:MAG TPA: transglutaminase family protein [Chthoniobacteraceae bacterium]|jgi:transglutaminase-like putative cysteine protease